jgi:hypothetical protein
MLAPFITQFGISSRAAAIDAPGVRFCISCGPPAASVIAGQHLRRLWEN